MPCPTPADHLKHCLETTQLPHIVVRNGEKMAAFSTLVNGGMKECVSCTSSQHLISPTTIGPQIRNGTDGSVMTLEIRIQYHLETSGRFTFVNHWVLESWRRRILDLHRHNLGFKLCVSVEGIFSRYVFCSGTIRLCGRHGPLLTSVGIEPATSRLDLPLLCRLSYVVEVK